MSNSEEQTLHDVCLELFPRMRKLRRLHINLDFPNESVLAAFHQNTSLERLSFTTEKNSRQFPPYN